MRGLKELVLFLLFSHHNDVSAFTLRHGGLWRLDVVHYNDFHARYEETSVKSASCSTDDALCLGGFPRLYSVITSLLKEKPDAVLLNAGDSFQGTYWYTLLKWNITQQFMNLLPHDAHAIGNHEFDDGPEGLAPYLQHLTAPVLAANMDASLEPSLQNLYRNHTIVERNGRMIGIIGVITVDTKIFASPGGVVFTDERVAAQREAALLAEQGVDIVILLSHAGLDVDRDIAANYGENIDLIVGGHTHSLLWNGAAPSGEAVDDAYPVIVQPSNTSDHKVLIVQASAFTKYMGNLSVYFDLRGNYHSWEGGPIFLNRTYPEDEHIKEMLRPYAERVHEAQRVVYGQTDVELDHNSCVYGECLLGDVFCDGMLEFVMNKYPSERPTVALIARGNIYGDIPEGSITAGRVFEAFPYHDRMEVFILEGRYLLQALEYSVSKAWDYHPFKGPVLLQVGGMRVKFNVSQPVNERLVSAEVWSINGYQTLEEDMHVRVTAPAFLANGGDGFTMFDKNRLDKIEVGYDSDIFEEYVRKHSPLKPEADGRLIIKE